jgi:hypothetical protein
MPTATETEQPQETARKVTFNSRSENQILTRRPPRNEINEFGQKTVLTEAEWFARKEESDEDFDDTPWKVEFSGHIFETDHPKLIAWLRQHRNLGVDAPSGFWEVPPTEDELLPTPADRFKEIAVAQAMAAPLEALKEIREAEENSHNRIAVLQAADAAIELYDDEPSESEAAAENPDTGDSSSTSKA